MTAAAGAARSSATTTTAAAKSLPEPCNNRICSSFCLGGHTTVTLAGIDGKEFASALGIVAASDRTTRNVLSVLAAPDPDFLETSRHR